VLDQHANLEKDILGVTTFLIGKQPKVEINQDLTDAIDNGEENVSILGRWRATLAHEGAHIVLHRPLFQISENQGNLFSEVNSLSSKEVIIKCFKKNVGFSRGQVDWREYQANKGMAAVLMPQGLVKKLAKYELGPGHDKLVEDYTREAVSLIESISDLFQVSRQAAEIRLKDVGIIIPRGQTQMKAM
jgi:Zn-dependent peptidase ImmA (M78 family)